MSVDRSLKGSGGLTRHRNVLTKAERLAKMEDEGRWVEGESKILGMPKVLSVKSVGGKKKKPAKKPDEK